jgi:hypothetical protein
MREEGVNIMRDEGVNGMQRERMEWNGKSKDGMEWEEEGSNGMRRGRIDWHDKKKDLIEWGLKWVGRGRIYEWEDKWMKGNQKRNG